MSRYGDPEEPVRVGDSKSSLFRKDRPAIAKNLLLLMLVCVYSIFQMEIFLESKLKLRVTVTGAKRTGKDDAASVYDLNGPRGRAMHTVRTKKKEKGIMLFCLELKGRGCTCTLYRRILIILRSCAEAGNIARFEI